jgi:hypothetical protein
MAISRTKTWSSGEVLTASDLNAEFDNILNNATSLVSPLTADLAFGGFRATGLSLGSVSSPAVQFTGDANTGVYSSAADVVDIAAGGIRSASFAAVASGVNYHLHTPSATGNPILYEAAGTDTDIGVRLAAKGAGTVSFWDGGSAGRELLILDGVASAVNEITIANAAAGGSPSIAVTGGDAAIDLTLAGKGTGLVKIVRADAAVAFLLESTEAGQDSTYMRLYHNSASPIDNDNCGSIQFLSKDEAGGGPYATNDIVARISDTTATTMDSTLIFGVQNNANAVGVNTNATLSSLGVWTDASGETMKEYEGDIEDVISKVKQLKTLGVYHSKNTPAEKLARAERHYSPTAEDFWDVFKLGNNPNKGNPGIAPKDVGWLAVKMALELDARLTALGG